MFDGYSQNTDSRQAIDRCNTLFSRLRHRPTHFNHVSHFNTHTLRRQNTLNITTRIRKLNSRFALEHRYRTRKRHSRRMWGSWIFGKTRICCVTSYRSCADRTFIYHESSFTFAMSKCCRGSIHSHDLERDHYCGFGGWRSRCWSFGSRVQCQCQRNERCLRRRRGGCSGSSLSFTSNKRCVHGLALCSERASLQRE